MELVTLTLSLSAMWECYVSIVVLATDRAGHTDVIALCNVRILREYCSIGRWWSWWHWRYRSLQCENFTWVLQYWPLVKLVTLTLSLSAMWEFYVSIVVLAASGASYTDVIVLCNVRILREYCSIGRWSSWWHWCYRSLQCENLCKFRETERLVVVWV